MTATLRTFRPDDLDALVELTLRAWVPIYQAWHDTLGDRLYALAYPDWHKSQAEAVRATCAKHAETTTVAVLDDRVVGFATVVLGELDENGARTGDLEMIGVDPDVQGVGVGGLLMDASLRIMREAGCAYANVWTGGDPGHGPARAMYEARGFTALPVVHYYKEL